MAQIWTRDHPQAPLLGTTRVDGVKASLHTGIAPAPLDELLVSIKMLAVVAVVGRLELHLVVVFFRGLVGLALAGEALDDAFGFGGLRGIRISVDEVDDLRASWRDGMSLM